MWFLAPEEPPPHTIDYMLRRCAVFFMQEQTHKDLQLDHSWFST